MIFTDYYAEQSCTAGRSTFIITGQCKLRLQMVYELNEKSTI
jgi:alkyl hydroperoxide reductase subunit AhpC